jgi:hypothetical protein
LGHREQEGGGKVNDVQYKPGPWKTRKGWSPGTIEIFRPNPKIKKPFRPSQFATVQINDDTKESIAKSRRDARLIAAAPDLLAVVNMIPRGIHPPNPNDNGSPCICSQCELAMAAEKALKKVTGKEGA